MGRLFWKFFACILLAQLAATVGVGAVFWLRDQARAQASGAHAIDAGAPAAFLLDAAAATLAHGGSAALRELAGASRRHSVFVIDEAGNDLLKRPVTAAMRSQAAQLLKEHGDIVRMLTAPDGARFMVFVPTLPGQGPGREFPGGPPPGRHFLPYIVILVATVASLLFAALLAWYFARPIRALRNAFEAAAAGDLAPRFANLPGARADELADLGRDFDRMTARLGALMDGQRRLLHDVSHELRSPLARLQAAIGLANQQPQKVASSLERIERESIRMDKLVGELLTLSRLEASVQIPATEEVALMDLVDGIVADARFEAGQQGRHIAVHGEAPVAVRCAPDLVWSAIENVIRNAIKHSPDGGAVTVELGVQRGMARIAVRDRGPGVDPAELQAIFAPFYRSGPGAAGVDGHGLGLAIAQRVVGAHGGAISASNRDGGGLCVVITLPVAD